MIFTSFSAVGHRTAIVRVVARDERGEQVATTITLNFDN